MIGFRSGGDGGDFCLGDRQAAGGFVGGGWVCSELTASRLLLLLGVALVPTLYLAGVVPAIFHFFVRPS